MSGPSKKSASAPNGGAGQDSLTTADVVAFLVAHPDFLQKNPEVLTALKTPSRDDGNVVDLQSFMIERLGGEVSRLRETQKDLLKTARNNLNTQARIHEAVLAMMTAASFEHLIEALTTDVAARLDLDVIRICVEASEDAPDACGTPGVRVLTEGRIDSLMGPDLQILLRPDVEPDPEIFGSAAALVQSDALVRLHVSSATPPGLLAFGSRRPDHFDHGQATELLTFLARTAEAQIRAWLDLPA